MRTYLYTEQPITYDGRQLSPHWLYRQFDLLGDAIAAFTGPCRVELPIFAAEVQDIWLAHCKVRVVWE